LPSSK